MYSFARGNANYRKLADSKLACFRARRSPQACTCVSMLAMQSHQFVMEFVTILCIQRSRLYSGSVKYDATAVVEFKSEPQNFGLVE